MERHGLDESMKLSARQFCAPMSATRSNGELFQRCDTFA
jgi:hypothetical protein